VTFDAYSVGRGILGAASRIPFPSLDHV